MILSYFSNFIFSIMIVIFLIAAAIEGLIFTIKSKYDWRSSLISVIYMLLRHLLIFYIPTYYIYFIYDIIYTNRIFTFDINNLFILLVLFLFVDFAYYWWHRFCHKIRVMWATHYVHHTTQQMNLLGGSRSSITEKLTHGALFFGIISAFGFSPRDVSVVLFLNVYSQLWIHCSWIPKIKVLDYFLNTPSNHRVHHQLKYLTEGKNFGGILIVFDRIFGTYQEEIPNEDHTYGLFDQQRSFNILEIEFRELIAVVHDIRSTKSLSSKLKFLVKYPGWKPEVDLS